MNTANLFSTKDHKVTIVVLDETAKSFYPVDPRVQLVQHPLSFGITREGNPFTRKLKLLGDVLKLRRLLKQLQPGIVIASEYPLAAAAILSRARKRSKVVSWEHHHFSELEKNLFWTKVFQLTYPLLDAVVCLNEDEKKLFQVVNSKPVVIPNFVQQAPTQAALDNKNILTVARIAHVKGIDLLLRAAGIVFEKHPDWKWKIIGQPDQDDMINRLIREQGLSGNLFIQPPIDHNIASEYQNVSMYVMTSRNECFPMTLLEAMSNGVPCIAFDCETGPRHIINNQENGQLVEKENPAKLAEVIISLVNDESNRKQMGENAFRSVQRFSPTAIYQLWKEKILFDQ